MSNNVSIYELLNSMICSMPEDNPIEDFEHMYEIINPGMMMKAIDIAKRHLANFKNKKVVSESNEAETANVFVTLGGDSYNQSFYNGIVAALLWLPHYLKLIASTHSNTISEKDLNTAIEVLRAVKLPQAHDIKEEVINGTRVQIIPSSTRHYAAFLSAIGSWLSDPVQDIKLKRTVKTNMDLVRYLANSATRVGTSVPFGAYYIGSIETNKDDMFRLNEELGKSFNWTDYMTPEVYKLNEPKFVVVNGTAPIVGIAGHPLTETYAAEFKNGKAKWLGFYVETEEFEKRCTERGLTTNDIKKYIMKTTPEQHSKNLLLKDNVARFIEENGITKQCFIWRHEMSSVADGMYEEEYM